MRADELLEIEATTTLRGPLAKRLLGIARQRGRPPVEALADIIEGHLTAPEMEDAGVLRAKIMSLHERHANEVKVLKKELTVLRGRYQEAMQDTLGEYPPKVAAALNKAAEARRMEADELARKIIITVATDDLFAAVLDG